MFCGSIAVILIKTFNDQGTFLLVQRHIYLVDWRLARDPRPAASKDELWLRIQAIWNSLPQTDIENPFNSIDEQH